MNNISQVIWFDGVHFFYCVFMSLFGGMLVIKLYAFVIKTLIRECKMCHFVCNFSYYSISDLCDGIQTWWKFFFRSASIGLLFSQKSVDGKKAINKVSFVATSIVQFHCPNDGLYEVSFCQSYGILCHFYLYNMSSLSCISIHLYFLFVPS